MSTRLKAICLGSAFLLAGCAHRDPAGQAPNEAPAVMREAPIGVTPRNQIVPLIDAHQHLMGPAAMSTLSRQPTPPPVAVPPAFQDLLNARAKGVDHADYADLYTPDAQVYAEEQGRWWVGEAPILDALGNFGAEEGDRYVPTSYALDGSAGYIAGVLRPKSGEDTHTFVFGVRKGADGRWRIASEMKQRIMPPVYAPSITAEKVIEVLDDAGIRYGTVLSTAYWFGDPDKKLTDAERLAGTRAENDWTIAEARKYPDRLIPFCGVNPVADYAIAELERCAALGIRGMKIHRNSKFDLTNADELEKLKQFFRALNRHGLAVVIHLRGDPQLWVDHIFPEAPDIPIQIAHMGSGAAELLADAIQSGRPGTQNLWFDWTQALRIPGLWGYGPSEGLSRSTAYPPEVLPEVAEIMRRIGLDRILYGSDMPLAWNPPPREWWRKTILTLPLTDDEIRDIADNLPPYVHQ